MNRRLLSAALLSCCLSAALASTGGAEEKESHTLLVAMMNLGRAFRTGTTANAKDIQLFLDTYMKTYPGDFADDAGKKMPSVNEEDSVLKGAIPAGDNIRQRRLNHSTQEKVQQKISALKDASEELKKSMGLDEILKEAYSGDLSAKEFYTGRADAADSTPAMDSDADTAEAAELAKDREELDSQLSKINKEVAELDEALKALPQPLKGQKKSGTPKAPAPPAQAPASTGASNVLVAISVGATTMVITAAASIGVFFALIKPKLQSSTKA